MSILVDEKNRVVVQGITGKEGVLQTKLMVGYGTDVAAGVTKGKGGQKVAGVPVFNTVGEAVEREGVNSSCILVPPAFAADAIIEAASAGLTMIVCITEGIPILDMVKVVSFLREKDTVLIGPNCPGIISPGKTKIGIMPTAIYRPGNIGVISRSGTLTYEIVDQLTRADLGQSTSIGIGGDPIVGTTFIDHLKRFNVDPETKGVVLIGEIGGNREEIASEYIKEEFGKPVLAFIAGQMAPSGKRMGHAGAIISGGKGQARSKVRALEEAGVKVVSDLGNVGELAWEIMGSL